MPLRLLAVALIAVAGCRGGTAAGDAKRVSASARTSTDTVVDDAGHLHARAPRRERVVSLVPSMTDWIVAIGGRSQLVGRTRFDRDSAVAELPDVGAPALPGREALLALDPDLVVLWDQEAAPGLGRWLEDVGIEVYVAGNQRMADALRHVRNLGILLGRDSAAAAAVRRVTKGLDRTRERLAGMRPTSVLWVVWPNPPTTAGGGTFVNEVIEAAGGCNVFGELAGWPRVSLEAIVERQPDALVFTDDHAGPTGVLDWIGEAPGWSALRAVREGRLLVAPADRITRPGPNLPEVVEELAAFLHPELAGPAGERAP